jgi:hypothetical protein
MQDLSQDLSWGWFTDKEMRQVDMTPDQKEVADAKWGEVLEAAKAHGGLKAYGEFLLAQEEKAHTEFCQLIELAIPALTSDYNWYIQGHELIGDDEYGNQAVIISFRTFRKKLKKGLTVQQIVDHEIADLEEYWEE